jgi:hypothetical protein
VLAAGSVSGQEGGSSDHLHPLCLGLGGTVNLGCYYLNPCGRSRCQFSDALEEAHGI